MPNASLVNEIRVASRLMVRELGFMNATLAATDYSPSAVHTLLEIENQGAMTAAQLVQMLGLEKSSVSRMLGKLVRAGEIQEVPSKEDARFKKLQLTAQGKERVARINQYGSMRVVEALAHLALSRQHVIAEGLSAYAHALAACRNGAPMPQNEIEIVSGYRPGMIGRISEMHASYYSRHYNFGYFFESKVAAGLADFAGRLDAACNRIWLAIHHGRIVGSVAIDGQDLGNNEAHLRWFILDDDCRGGGVGRRLLTEAMRFCDSQGFAAVQLWTFSGLDAARRLYESFGFRLTKEWQGEQWGSKMQEQQFARQRI
ncbi:MarR family transcriptional regulator [Enterobacter hormaechei]|uniref:Bifunctional helix-turn-helix transcriptional regulator/GNAT family N-acetyltransferase n=1 Tax=Phytobacter ursingii TaxID=1972431 RepID=A0AB35RHT8_9ENTR|nr:MULTISPECIES: bifunctional helix-turn-helix transcriptional regulator/GNAT family N-acetyltransferase [Enterobacteriaceae]MDV2861498.1 bifunctional helix-turn-helix transcriptional regulator/GNAT family N-acetyltransferase [Phytobacter ursingii]GJL34957.1 MarR family transcriptional regulator [Enterobacter hormaechei]